MKRCRDCVHAIVNLNVEPCRSCTYPDNSNYTPGVRIKLMTWIQKIWRPKWAEIQ